MSRWLERRADQSCLRIGHRGAASLEPQNTLRAFQRAIDLGVDAVEFDVRWTADRQLVVVHDEDLAKATNGAGFVHETTLAQLRLLDAGQGERIPTLNEVLDLVAGKALINVDLKQLDYEEQIVGVIKAHGLEDDVLVSSLLPLNLQRVGALSSRILTIISYPEDKGGASTKPFLAAPVSVALAAMRAALQWRVADMITRAKAGGAMLYYRLLTPAVVDAVHRQGGFVGAWTVDSPADIHRIHDMGVDCITSNRPDLLVELVPHSGR